MVLREMDLRAEGRKEYESGPWAKYVLPRDVLLHCCLLPEDLLRVAETVELRCNGQTLFTEAPRKQVEFGVKVPVVGDSCLFVRLKIELVAPSDVAIRYEVMDALMALGVGASMDIGLARPILCRCIGRSYKGSHYEANLFELADPHGRTKVQKLLVAGRGNAVIVTC
jgi:hypothetical protein